MSDDKTIQDRLLRMRRGLVGVRNGIRQPYMPRHYYERVDALMMLLIAEVDDILAEHPATPAEVSTVDRRCQETGSRIGMDCHIEKGRHWHTPAEVDEVDECERCEGTGDRYGRSRGPKTPCPDCPPAEPDAGDVGLSEGELFDLTAAYRGPWGDAHSLPDRIVWAVAHIVAVREREAAARAWDEGVRQAIEWLRSDYVYGEGPDWRENGCQWIADRLSEHTARADRMTP